jgi:hypothetical protein
MLQTTLIEIICDHVVQWIKASERLHAVGCVL